MSGGLHGVSFVKDGLFSAYAVIQDEKSSGTGGGTFTSGAWQTRDLNTEHFDPFDLVTIASNRFTIQAGRYFIKAKAPAWNVNSHVAKLFNFTDTVDVEIGSVQQATASANSAQTYSEVLARIDISTAKAYEIRHQCDTTKTNDGFGVSMAIGAVEIYTVIEIWKEA